MGRLVRWTAGIVGIAALARLLRRRRHGADAPGGVAPAADPAAELREKLAGTRDAAAETAAAAPMGDGPVALDEPAAATIEERRARVHEKAQEAIDAMSADAESNAPKSEGA